MRYRVLLALAPLLLSACTRSDGQPGPDPPAGTGQDNMPDLKKVVSGVVDRTNAFRKEQGLEPVAVSEKLTDTARYFADFMARTDKYGHEADGKQPAERAQAHGYDYCLVAENIAYAYHSDGFTTDRLTGQFVTDWKESPEHRKNMLDPDVTETGVAVARSEESGKYYAVQLFGRPKSAAIEFSIGNEAGEAVEYELEGKEFTLEPRVVRTHTLCRPAELKPQWPGEPKAVRPEDGTRLTVVKGDDGFQLRRK